MTSLILCICDADIRVLAFHKRHWDVEGSNEFQLIRVEVRTGIPRQSEQSELMWKWHETFLELRVQQASWKEGSEKRVQERRPPNINLRN